MFEQDVTVTTKHGRMSAFAACPDGAGPFPPVIFYMDAPGTREELRNMARRIAKQGYFCLLPDMYYRLGTVRFDIPRRDDAMSGGHPGLDEQHHQRTGYRRYRRHDRLVRCQRQSPPRPGRLRRPLHERLLHHDRIGKISAPDESGGIALRREHRYRQARLIPSVAAAGKRRALLCVRRA